MLLFGGEKVLILQKLSQKAMVAHRKGRPKSSGLTAENKK